MEKLVVLSGGMDSSTALALAMAEKTIHDSVSTLTFNYGSKHNEKENEAAKNISLFYGVKNTLINLDFMRDHFKSDLLKSGGDIPEGHYADPNMIKTVVPFRNGIMLAIAVGFAESRGADEVIIGNHFGDHAVYPDCRTSFMSPMAEAAKFGTYKNIRIVRPFEAYTKTNICALAMNLRVPLEITYTCYKGDIKHCGVCGSCHERKEAFLDSGTIDPTPYLD